MDRPRSWRGRRRKRPRGKDNRVHAHDQQVPEEATPRQPDFNVTAGVGDADTSFHRKPTDKSGGYDYEFVDCPPDELICSICLSVFRDPNLTSCCGNHFCQSCIRRIKSIQRPCPLCQEQYYTIMLDKFFSRRVKGLKIKCPSSGQGCEWVSELGSLQKHLDVSCGFVEVTCDYCRSEDILRHSLADHRKRICPLRPYSCEYCGRKDTWEFITHEHLGVCEKYTMECPNKCGIGGIQRIDFDKHVREECPLEEIGCKYAGCQVCLPRKDIDQHFRENVSSHLSMVVISLQQKLTEKDEVINELKANVESQRREIAALTASVQSLKVSARSQSQDICTLTTNVQSQGKDISKFRGNVQSRNEERTVKVESCAREQNRRIEKLEATVYRQTRALEKVDNEAADFRKIFYVEVFQLLKNIASRNHDIYISNSAGATVLGATVGSAAAFGITAGRAAGPVGAILGSIVGGSIGAIAGLASCEPEESVVNRLSKMSEKEQQVMASSAIEVAYECGLNVVEELFTKAILRNPKQARSFLVTVLRKQNFEIHCSRH